MADREVNGSTLRGVVSRGDDLTYSPTIGRRKFLQNFGAAALLASGCGGRSPTRDATAQNKPNIVLIMADDMGFSDIGCYGGEISTPNLDLLAEQGLRFTQFYNTARCCPTRASLLTGLYSHQAGIGHMVSDRGVPAYQGYLNDQCVTIAEALKPGGYTTLMSGKWHVGEEQPHWPTDRGFDRCYGLISGGSNYFKLDGARQMVVNDVPFTPGDGFYMTDAFSDNAVKFISEHAASEANHGKPFFLYVPYTAPHWPLHAWPEDIAKYKGKYMTGWDALRKERHARMIKMGLVDDRWPLTPRDADVPAWEDVEEKELEDLKMAVYAAQIDRMDQDIGRILDKLSEVGAEENTLVMFLADNGGCAEEIDIPKGTPRNTWGDPEAPPGPATSFDSYGVPWANASNTPFRLYKHWVHEGGISSPLICRWPGGFKESGALTNEPGHVIDLMATCLDVADVDYPDTHNGNPVKPLEGKSLRPIFETGTRAGHQAIFWEHEGNRAVRQDHWKLVSRFDSERAIHGDWELYNLESDRTETDDLAAANADKVKQLASLYQQWAERAGVVPWDELNRPGQQG